VVFGILTEEGRIDVERCKKLIACARPLRVTCHRAFDMTRDSYEALEDCVQAGFDRILCSGRQPSAAEGSELIRELVSCSRNRISIMPGSGVNEQNAQQLVKETGVHEIHFSAKQFVQSGHTRFNHLISFLDVLPDDSGRLVANADTIQRLKKLLNT
jgi:copper homeostasis protein